MVNRVNLEERYYSQGGKKYIVIGNDELLEASYEVNMLERNQPKPFLPLTINWYNGSITLQYEISGAKSLSEYAARKEFDAKDLRELAKALDYLKNVVDEYLLNLDCVLLDEKYIFLDSSGFRFMYYPDSDGDFYANTKELWEFILARLDHREKSTIVSAYGIYQDLLEGVYEPDKHFEKQVEKETVEMVYTNEYVEPERVEYEVEEDNALDHALQNIGNIGKVLATIALTLFGLNALEYINIPVIIIVAVLVVGGLMIVGSEWGNNHKDLVGAKVSERTENMPFRMTSKELKEDTNVKETETFARMDLVGNDGTEVLSLSKEIEEESACKRLIPTDESLQVIELVHFPTVIGSSNQCNAIIRQPVVSRVHCIITREGNVMFVQDMNSTNKTYVNGVMLEQGERKIINLGDVLTIANIDYRFEK